MDSDKKKHVPNHQLVTSIGISFGISFWSIHLGAKKSMGIQGNDLPLQQSREWVHARGCLAPASRRARMRARGTCGSNLFSVSIGMVQLWPELYHL